MDITQKEFKQLVEYIKGNFGINLTENKIGLVTNRLGSLVEKSNYKNFSEYYEYIISDKTGVAVAELINKITTNYTYFWREEKHFEFFRDQIIPYLEETQKDSRDLRIWSAGCSSGEEPYTLQMLLKENLGSKGWDAKILATDISTQVLMKAEKGVYASETITNLPAILKNKYFNKVDHETVKVADSIRNEIIFKKFNLMNNFPFKKKFQVIFCRNVMIYFDVITKRELINKFYEFTEPGGYLFVGHSESVEREYSDYTYIKPAIYRKER